MLDGESAAAATSTKFINWTSNASRVGFKGMTKGMFYNFEMGANTDANGGGTALSTRGSLGWNER